MFLLPDIEEYILPKKTLGTVIEPPKEANLDLSISPDEMAYMTKCYKTLRKLNLIKTQYEFCEQFLGKSQHYMAMVISSGRAPSVSSLHNLIKSLEAQSEKHEFDKISIYNVLMRLVEEGKQHLYHRFIKIC